MKYFIKFLMLVVCIFLSYSNYASVFFISPSGNDATGNGSATNPWRSLYRATSLVATPGDTIYVKAGTYLETQVCRLRPGVSIRGEGVSNTIIRNTVTTEWMSVLLLESPEGTAGNQLITGLQFDGQNLASFQAILVQGRGNVEISHCLFQNFREWGVIFQGKGDNQEGRPGIYARGNSFHDNEINNCSYYNVYGRGALAIGGQDGIRIFNNKITQTQRPVGSNGFCIKLRSGGFNRNIKIQHNTLVKIPSADNFPGVTGWDFAIELWATESGSEISHNKIIGGAIDLDKVENPLGSKYGVWIHDNEIYNTILNSNYENGIILENSINDVIIERNTIYNKTTGIHITTRNGNSVRNVIIRNNLIFNVGRKNTGSDGFGILAQVENSPSSQISQLYIQNNTFIAGSGVEPWFGMRIIPGYNSLDNIFIQNNIFQGFLGAPVALEGAVTNHLWFQHNNLFANGNNNNPQFGTPATLITTNNLKLNPMLTPAPERALQQASPMIDAGINIGLPFQGSAPDIGHVESCLWQISPYPFQYPWLLRKKSK